MKQNPAEILCAYVVKHYGRRLTPKQLRGPWTYIGSYGGELSGVVIEADGEHTGYRIMLTDMDAMESAPPPRRAHLRGIETPVDAADTEQPA